MHITCNAVGDPVALIELAIKVADISNEARKAPAECRTLLSELRALQSLVELSPPIIEFQANDTLRRLLDERLHAVAQRILDGLALVVECAELNVPNQALGADYETKSPAYSQTNASARECRETVSQSFTSLIYALLV